jgi:hypothetical protein
MFLVILFCQQSIGVASSIHRTAPSLPSLVAPAASPSSYSSPRADSQVPTLPTPKLNTFCSDSRPWLPRLTPFFYRHRGSLAPVWLRSTTCTFTPVVAYPPPPFPGGYYTSPFPCFYGSTTYTTPTPTHLSPPHTRPRTASPQIGQLGHRLT